MAATKSGKTVNVTNLTTGKTYPVTEDSAKVIKENSLTSKLFKFEDSTELPELGKKITTGSSEA